MFFPFAVGVLTTAYLSNPAFKKATNSAVSDLAKKVIETLNAGGNQDARDNNISDN